MGLDFLPAPPAHTPATCLHSYYSCHLPVPQTLPFVLPTLWSLPAPGYHLPPRSYASLLPFVPFYVPYHLGLICPSMCRLTCLSYIGFRLPTTVHRSTATHLFRPVSCHFLYVLPPFTPAPTFLYLPTTSSHYYVHWDSSPPALHTCACLPPCTAVPFYTYYSRAIDSSHLGRSPGGPCSACLPITPACLPPAPCTVLHAMHLHLFARSAVACHCCSCSACTAFLPAALHLVGFL